MKNLVTVLLVSVCSLAGTVHKANAQYNSFIKKEYRGHFNNNMEALKDSILFGKNAQKFLLVPIEEFDRVLKERITIYNNVVPHYDQIGDEEVDKVCERLWGAKADPKTMIPMTSWKNGAITRSPRFPEDGENLAYAFTDWPSILSMLCINVTEWPIIPLPNLGNMMASNTQTTPNQTTPKDRWRPGSNSSVSSASNSNVNNINITNNIPATATQPFVQQQPQQEQESFGRGVAKTAIGTAIGYGTVRVIEELLDGNGNRRSGNNSSRRVETREHDRRDTYQRDTYTRPRGNRNDRDRDHGGTRVGRPSQGRSGNSNNPSRRTDPPTRDNPGRNGNAFGNG